HLAQETNEFKHPFVHGGRYCNPPRWRLRKRAGTDSLRAMEASSQFASLLSGSARPGSQKSLTGLGEKVAITSLAVTSYITPRRAQLHTARAWPRAVPV